MSKAIRQARFWVIVVVVAMAIRYFIGLLWWDVFVVSSDTH